MIRKVLAGYYRLSYPLSQVTASVYDYLGDTFKLSAFMVRKSAEKMLPLADNVEEHGFIEAVKILFKECMDEGEDDFEEYMNILGQLKELRP